MWVSVAVVAVKLVVIAGAVLTTVPIMVWV